MRSKSRSWLWKERPMRNRGSARRGTNQHRWDRFASAIDSRFRSSSRGALGSGELDLISASVERCLRAMSAESGSRIEIASAIGVECRYGSIR